MILKGSEICRRLESSATSDDPLFIVPKPQPDDLAASYEAASVDLRLGTWFLVSRQTRVPLLEIPELSATDLRLSQLAKKLNLDSTTADSLRAGLIPEVRENQVARRSYVKFGQDFILHPGSFALAVTLEWLRLPRDLAGYVTSRSAWGRRGLIIATAVGIHPGFSGCLTLELGNVGDVPLAIRPGMAICQLFLHRAGPSDSASAVGLSTFGGKRRPALGYPKPDNIAKKLGRAED